LTSPESRKVYSSALNSCPITSCRERLSQRHRHPATGREHAGAKIACTTVAKCRGCLPVRNLQAVDISTIDEMGTI